MRTLLIEEYVTDQLFQLLHEWPANGGMCSTLANLSNDEDEAWKNVDLHFTFEKIFFAII